MTRKRKSYEPSYGVEAMRSVSWNGEHGESVNTEPIEMSMTKMCLVRISRTGVITHDLHSVDLGPGNRRGGRCFWPCRCTQEPLQIFLRTEVSIEGGMRGAHRETRGGQCDRTQ